MPQAHKHLISLNSSFDSLRLRHENFKLKSGIFERGSCSLCSLARKPICASEPVDYHQFLVRLSVDKVTPSIHYKTNLTQFYNPFHVGWEKLASFAVATERREKVGKFSAAGTFPLN